MKKMESSSFFIYLNSFKLKGYSSITAVTNNMRPTAFKRGSFSFSGCQDFKQTKLKD